jgi:cytochrome c553
MIRKIVAAGASLAVIALVGAVGFGQKTSAQQAQAKGPATSAADMPPITPLAGPEPKWLFTMTPIAPIPPPAPGDEVIQHLPGNSITFPLSRVKDRYHPADWWPKDHPKMPTVVEYGRKADGLFACSYCHLPNGFGRPENASLAGKPADYMIAQMKAFKEGTRTGMRMPAIAKIVTDKEIADASAYFASVKAGPWIEVVESKESPVWENEAGLMVPVEPRRMEPLGERIVEVAKDQKRANLRDARSPFIAYVPEGAIAEGEVVVNNKADPTKACTACHGEGMRGAGSIPALAGRSPIYIVRELYEFQSGKRHDALAPLMTPVVATMTLHDMITSAAYIGSLKP